MSRRPHSGWRCRRPRNACFAVIAIVDSSSELPSELYALDQVVPSFFRGRPDKRVSSVTGLVAQQILSNRASVPDS
jgi:hypothetical protein